MNARTHNYQLTVELRQVKESVLCFMHTLLLHRTLGKFTYSHETSYTLGSIGMAEATCESIDVTYVHVNSDELKQQLEEKVNGFIGDVTVAARGIAHADSSRIPEGTFTHGTDVLSANVQIEFFTKKKKKGQWQNLFSMGDESAVWEIWELQLDIVKVQENDGLALLREKVSDEMSNIMLSICSVVNRGQYIPKMPHNTDYNTVFDGSISDCQPYNYRILWPGLAAQLQASHGDSSSNLLQNGFMRKILKDTLSF
uniref:Autophagy-related protein 101 n=1 Tax=Steinernema glaseri TaxID=37863 RepID=A0A1I7ZKR6_9BILA